MIQATSPGFACRTNAAPLRPAFALAAAAAEPQKQGAARRASGAVADLDQLLADTVIEMAELTIGDMMERVPEGQARTFGQTRPDPDGEHYFQVWQSWDYQPVRLQWRNGPGLLKAPWAGSRKKPRTPLSTLATPEVRFDGPSVDVVDLYGAMTQAFFISDRLFRLIEGVDPDSLEDVPFLLDTRDAAIPFHAVMPRRVVEAVDPARTKVQIEDEGEPGAYYRRVQFPDGIVFKNEVLEGAASFSDHDAPGWYWSKELIETARTAGIRGLYAQSMASVPPREVARL